MGMILSCVATSCACSTAQCCAGAVCSCCGKAIPFGTAVKTRLMYVLLFLMSIISCWVFVNWGPQLYDKIPSVIIDKQFCDIHDCFGPISVYRISFGLSVFFAVQGLMMIGVSRTNDCRATIQNGFWFFKLLGLVGLVAAAFYIPMSFFVYYGYVALAAAVVFLFFQLVLLVDFAHSWTEDWLEKWNEDEENVIWYRLLVGSAIILLLVSIGLVVAMYVLFTDKEGCSLNAVFVTIALLTSIFITCLAIHPKIQERSPRSGLLQPAVVSFYMNYLVWSAIMSEPSDSSLGGCNDLTSGSGILSGGSQSVSMIMGAVLVITAVCYSALRTSSQHNALLGGVTSNDTESQLLSPAASIDSVASAAEGGKAGSTNAEEAAEEEEPIVYNYSFFHFIFMLASMYICMLMTNWAVATKTDIDHMNPGDIGIDRSMTSVWIKIASSWMVALLFTWSLIAPIIFPDRDFGN